MKTTVKELMKDMADNVDFIDKKEMFYLGFLACLLCHEQNELTKENVDQFIDEIRHELAIPLAM